MKHMLNKFVRRIVGVGSRGDALRCAFTTMLAFAGSLPLLDQLGRADQLVLQMDIHQTGSAAGGNLSYYAFAFLNTTNTPITYDEVYSWNTNYQFQGGVGTGSTTYGLSFGPLADMLNAFTNGPWKLVTNVGDPSEQTYYFSMSAPNFTTDTFPAVHVLAPVNGAVNVTNNPSFTWTGTNNYPEVDVNESGSYQNFYNSATLPPDATDWNPGQTLYQGVFSFDATYFNSNAPAVLLISTPTNSLGQSPPGWITTNRLFADDSAQFTVGTVDPSGTSHTLVARYAWDGTNSDGTASGVDSSGNGYDMNFGGSFGSQGGANSTIDSAVGPRAIQFHNGDGNSAGYVGWNPTPAGLLTALSGSFSISCWIKTTQTGAGGWNQAPAYYGAGIISADNSGQANDVIPLALTGSKVGFNTGGAEDVTLNSATSVNDGNYHHVVVTRNQQTGQKIIYIDGVLDSFSSGTTNLLTDPQLLTIGALSDASDPDASSTYYYNGYDGELDDVQIYSGVLSSGEVANLFASPGSTAANSGGFGGGHKNVAHYTFDNSGDLGHDSSGNGNDMNGETVWGAQHQSDTDAEVGGAIRFFGTDAISPSGQALTNLDTVLAGSFTFSAWVKTTITNGADYNNAFFGAVIFWAYNDRQGDTNDTIPLAITGSKAAFTTRGGDPGVSDNLHSISSVNDGNYHLITVTRDANTGEKKIYVDGNFETSQIGTTNPLDGNNYFLSIGGYAYILNTTSTTTNYSSYAGLLDDLQIYSGVLSGSDVAYLYNNPGSSVPDTAGEDFNPALNTTGLPWTTSGDTTWFIENTNTSDGMSAAQSGIVTGNQSSTLSVTVTGPGTLTFYWACMADNTGFDYEVYTNGDPNGGYMDDLYYNTSGWYQDGPFNIPAGTQTISWTAFAGMDEDPTEAGFLDQVSFVPDTAPTITLNPFNQTNYPGYSVWLSANATGNPAATWQWYKVGVGAISGATSSSYIPTNSGTAGVVGSYYAIASNDVGSANTTTAAVSFVSAPLPSDWSAAFKSPFYPVDNTTVTKDYYYGCLADTNGNIYVAAEFGGNTTVGTLNLNSGSGGDAAAIVKQSPTGTPLWAVGVTNNGSGSSSAECIAAAPGGGIYLAGNFSGTNWLGTNQLTDAGNGDMFLARFDANGSNLWVRTFGGTNADFLILNSLASDPSGNITLSGLVGAGPVTIGGSNYNVVGQEGVLIQLDQTGAVRWSQLLPGEWVQYLTCSAGRLYASVNTTSSGGMTNVVIGGMTNLTDRSWAIASLNCTNGQAIWVRGVGAQYGSNTGNSLIDDVPRLAVSGTNVFLTGVAYGSSALFGAITVNFGDLRGQYFARYDTNGNAQVATAYGSVTTSPIAAVADASGNVYVSGNFDTFSFFGNDMIAAPVAMRPDNGGFSQAFLAKFDLNGNPLWARKAVSPATVNLLGIALATDGVWASGWSLSGQTPPIESTAFGTNNVFSDALFLEGAAGGGVSILWYPGGVLAKITETTAAAAAVTLLNPQDNGANFQFQFLSQAGFNHSILYTTNLAVGNWQTNSTIGGDGTVKTISLPFSLFSPAQQGFIRVSTQ